MASIKTKYFALVSIILEPISIENMNDLLIDKDKVFEVDQSKIIVIAKDLNAWILSINLLLKMLNTNMLS